MDPSSYEMSLTATGISQSSQMHSGGHASASALSNQLMLLQNFWQSQLQAIEHGELDFKNFQLPLARIKKVMKTDEDVKVSGFTWLISPQMISAEAPIIFAKACEIFILELTLRSWLHTEDSKRRTLQRSDVSAAIQKTDTFDFLIDIVPREDSRSMAKKLENDYRGSLLGDPSYYLPSQLAMQQQLQMQNPYATGGVPMQGGPSAPSGASIDQIMYYQQQAQQQLQQQMQMMHHRHQVSHPQQAGGSSSGSAEGLGSTEYNAPSTRSYTQSSTQS